MLFPQKIIVDFEQGVNLSLNKISVIRGGLMVSALDSGSGGPGSSPGRGYCVVFLVKASLTIN